MCDVSSMVKLHTDFSPQFFVVGAPKAGTTAVYHWLRSHPTVFLPSVKEPSYFAYVDSSATPRSGPYDPDYVRQITSKEIEEDRRGILSKLKAAGIAPFAPNGEDYGRLYLRSEVKGIF
jgi:hypothetical protein